jgi:hypothetical protein
VRELGVEWLAVGWNMSWWFEHYPEWNRRLREGSQRVLAHKLVTVFKLNP